MSTKCLIVVIALAGSALTLPAQTPETGPAPEQPVAPVFVPPPPAVAPAYGYYYGSGDIGPDPTLAGAVTVPYAFNWHASGISAELGALWRGGNFLGGEFSYYGGENERYDVYNGATYLGSFHSNLELTTLDLAYRYTVPVWSFEGRPWVMLYLGASGGVAFVNYTNDGSFFGFHNNDDGNWTGEVIAGLQVNVGPRVALRLGYRYVGVSDAWRFDQSVTMDSSVIEAGVAIRY